MTTDDILQSIHITNRVIAASAAIIGVNETAADNIDDPTILHHIHNAGLAVEAMLTRQQVDASPRQLAEAYDAFRKPGAPAIQTPTGSPMTHLADQLDQFGHQTRSIIVATIGDLHPEQMPRHLRDALWLAIAAHDALNQAAAAARRQAHGSLLIATGR